MSSNKKNVKIVVLGDIGHSPRMTNHALSLAKSGHFVDIIGYGDSDPMNSLKLSPKIYYHYLTSCPKIRLKLLNYIWKTIWTSINLFFLLFITRKSDVVLVQNPPAIPSLYMSYLYCKIIRAKLVVDWHNYAHTIMALSVGQRSPLVSITKTIETAIGRRADHNFCVSKAMQRDLETKWHIRAEVLYDRPSSAFSPVALKDKHQFFLRLSKTPGFEIFRDEHNEDFTIFTSVSTTGDIVLKEDRPAFLVSSTSWTEDEDFSILLTALQDYEDHCQNGNQKKLPKLIVAITGKGPLKTYYLQDIKRRHWEHIQVITPWLDINDYPSFIGSADFGLSLHTSSSGLDLPMKVVDLFGAIVPVLAYNFTALDELVIDGQNGYVFSNEQELSGLLQKCFEGFPNNERANNTRKNFQEILLSLRSFTWEKSWRNVAGPVFSLDVNKI